MSARTPPTAVDLFCGCGGFSTGLLDAGVRVLAGFDHEKRSIQVYDYNHRHRGATGRVADLATLDPEEILQRAGAESVDIVVAGPPCQAFSIIGKRQGTADARGALLPRTTELIAALKPRVCILENVPNLTQIDEGALVAETCARLTRAGYTMRSGVLSAADFGVAQMRKRLFMMGVRGVRAFDFPPAPTHGGSDLFQRRHAARSVREVIDDLPDVDTPEGEAVPNHEPTVHTASMLDAFRVLEPGTRDPKSHHDRLHPDRLAYTLRAGSGNFSPLRPIHYRYDRVITVRESARIQGFEDWFIWPDDVPRLQQYRQVGNAVPPPLAAALGRHAAAVCGWRLDPTAMRGDPDTRAPHSSRTPAERRRDRMSRIRGASLGQRVG